MKKLLSLVLVLSMCVAAVACTAQEEPAPVAADPTQAAEPAPTDEPTPTEEPVAEWTPDGPITVYMSVSAGGSNDLEVKALQQSIEEQLGVQLVFEYQTGGGGVVAVQQAARANPDGYSILSLSTPVMCIKELTGSEMNIMEDFTYLTNVVSEYRVLAARPNAPYSTLEELIDYCKAGNTPSAAHSSIGSSGHLQLLMIEEACGIDISDVPFDGNAGAKAAFLGDHVELWAIDAVSAIAQVEAGECVVLAVCGEERHPSLPDVPTFKELGYDVVSSTNRGFIMPAGAPQEVIDRFIEVFETAIQSEAFKAYAETNSLSVNMVSGDEYYELTRETYDTAKQYTHLFGG